MEWHTSLSVMIELDATGGQCRECHCSNAQSGWIEWTAVLLSVSTQLMQFGNLSAAVMSWAQL